MFAVCVHYATHTKNCGNNISLRRRHSKPSV